MGSIQLARLFGIRIGASPSWFVVLFLMIYWLSGHFGDVLHGHSNTTAYATAVAAALLFFVSLVLHELGHALVARRNGVGVTSIDLWFFGGLARLTREPATPGQEFRIAGAGPAVTFLLIVVCAVAGALAAGAGGFGDMVSFGRDAGTPALALLSWLVWINTVVLVFNLVPAFPLDGGRLVKAIAWRATGDANRGTRLAARLGQGFAYLLMGGGVYLLLVGDPFSGLWFLVLGWFLAQAARGAVVTSRFSERLGGVTVADVMDSHPVVVPGEISLNDAHDEYFLRYRWPWFPAVDRTGRFLGILRQESLEGAVSDGGAVSGGGALTVGDLLAPGADADSSVGRDTPIEQLLDSQPLRRFGALMVVDGDERLCGVVTLEQVRRALASAVPGPV
jgi:Zn-dependent protease